MASTTSENRKRNEKKSTEQEEAHFVSRVCERERERGGGGGGEGGRGINSLICS